MFKVMKYLRESKWTVVMVIVLLIVQASSELALPSYTSDIVDVGIMQGGIAEVAPTEMRASTWELLQFFMTGAETETAQAAYEKNAAGNWALVKKDRATLDELNAIFPVPMLMITGMNAQFGEEVTPEAINGMIASGMMTREQLLARREEAAPMIAELGEMVVEQRALVFTKAEYEALGMDMTRIQTNYLLLAGAKMLGITLAMAVAAVAVGFLAARTAGKIGMNLRGRLFSKVMSFSTGDIEKFSTASLITRSTNDIQQVQMVSVMMLRMVLYAPIMGIGGVLKVLRTHTGLDWIIVVAVVVLMGLVSVLMSIAMPKFKSMQALIDRINLVAREILSGLSVIRAFNRSEHENERFGVANTNLMKTQLFTQRTMTFMMPLMMLIMNGISLAIVWFGAKGVDMGTLQVGDMLAFISYTMQIVMSFLMLTMISVMLPRAAVAAGRIDEVLATEPSIEDKPGLSRKTRDDWQGVISFDHVSFRYPDADADVLSDIHFTARPGQTTAIIGSTGSGKSTLLNLIPRFFDVTEGKLAVDGVDIRDITQHELHSLMGYVPQKGVLFSGTIETNLKYAGEQVDDQDMEFAAKIAQAEGFISEKPDGYQDPIAQDGTNVSGGQKQRLSIARALAMKPKVLLFDDSFSALDYKTDVMLRRALNENIKGATVVIVAQRISTVLHADQIIVLEEGRMAGIGTHAELLETCHTYQEIAKSQLSEAELKGGKGA